MQIEKNIIEKYFKFVRTWDVTKELPEGSVDEYEFRCKGFVCRLMYYKAREWEKPHWELEATASNPEYHYRELKVNWLESLEDLVDCINVFINIDPKVLELHDNLMQEALAGYELHVGNRTYTFEDDE